MYSFKEFLTEKLIVVNGGKQYGQVVFLVGATASGKNFAFDYFMESGKFKVIDTDEWKRELLIINKAKHLWPELDNLDLRNPKDVEKLHQFTLDHQIKLKFLTNLFSQKRNPEVLPNICFNITLKRMSDFDHYLPFLLKAGYDPLNISIIWVLANYQVAFERNKKRDRVVPEDIFFMTHRGVATTMSDIIFRNQLPTQVDGELYVILNNKENTLVYMDPLGVRNNPVIKSFLYLKLKEKGKSIKSESEIQNRVFNWILGNAPELIEN